MLTSLPGSVFAGSSGGFRTILWERRWQYPYMLDGQAITICNHLPAPPRTVMKQFFLFLVIFTP
jgi:hypothetical protein